MIHDQKQGANTGVKLRDTSKLDKNQDEIDTSLDSDHILYDTSVTSQHEAIERGIKVHKEVEQFVKIEC